MGWKPDTLKNMKKNASLAVVLIKWGDSGKIAASKGNIIWLRHFHMELFLPSLWACLKIGSPEIFLPLFHYISGMYHDWLVVLTILKNISQWKNVWNHQPDDIPWYTPIFRHGLMGIAPCPPNGACLHVATSDRCDRWCPVGAPHQAEATAPAPAVARSI